MPEAPRTQITHKILPCLSPLVLNFFCFYTIHKDMYVAFHFFWGLEDRFCSWRRLFHGTGWPKFLLQNPHAVIGGCGSDVGAYVSSDGKKQNTLFLMRVNQIVYGSDPCWSTPTLQHVITLWQFFLPHKMVYAFFPGIVVRFLPRHSKKCSSAYNFSL